MLTTLLQQTDEMQANALIGNSAAAVLIYRSCKNSTCGRRPAPSAAPRGEQISDQAMKQKQATPHETTSHDP